MALASRRVPILGRVRVGGAALAAVGVALALSGAATVIGKDDAPPYEGSALQQALGAMPDVAEFESDRVVTDCGSPVRLGTVAAPKDIQQLFASERAALDGISWQGRLLRCQPADELSNCHGWVFTGGHFWVSAEQVEVILDENGYTPAPAAQAGDLVIYREDGEIVHTAVVKVVCDDGTVLVEGKWGWMGVFLHRARESCFGKNYVFYRSPRQGGHLLAGLHSTPEATPSLHEEIFDVCE